MAHHPFTDPGESPGNPNDDRITWRAIFTLAGLAVGAIFTVVLIIFVIAASSRAYTRYQRVQDAKNQNRVVQMQVTAADQRIQLEIKEAQIRLEEAKGIAQAQQTIAGTLTTEYLTYLSIQAQMDFANSDNDTIIYIPVGDNGVPLIRDTSQDGTASNGE